MAGICLMSYEMNQFGVFFKEKNTSAEYHRLCPEDRSVYVTLYLAIDCCLNAVCLHACTDITCRVQCAGREHFTCKFCT